MLTQDEIAQVIISISDEPEVLGTIEKIALADSFQRNALLDVLLQKFRSESKDELLLSFLEQMRSDAFCPLVLAAINYQRNPPSPIPHYYHWIYGAVIISACTLVMVVYIQMLSQAQTQGDVLKIARDKIEACEAQIFNLQTALSAMQTSRDRNIGGVAKNLPGRWTNFNAIEDGYLVQYVFSAEKRVECIQSVQDQTSAVQGSWEIALDDCVILHIKHESGKMENRQLKII